MTETTISRTAVARPASGTNRWVVCMIALVLALSFSMALAFGAIVERLWTGDVSVAAQNADRTDRRPFEHSLAREDSRHAGVTSPYLPHIVDRWFDEVDPIDAAK